jgi:IS5 family transposase
MNATRPTTGFAGLDASEDVAPDECAVLRFSDLPEQHQLGKTIFADVVGELSGKGLSTMRGTVVDAALITAPSSTRSEDKHVAKKRSPSATGAIGRRTGPSQ